MPCAVSEVDGHRTPLPASSYDRHTRRFSPHRAATSPPWCTRNVRVAFGLLFLQRAFHSQGGAGGQAANRDDGGTSEDKPNAGGKKSRFSERLQS